MATHLTLLKFLFLLFFSSFWTSHALYIKPGGMLSSFTGPLLDSPNGRFGLDFTRWSNYTNLCVFLVSSNDTANVIWYSRQGIPSANDSDEFILENKDGALTIRRKGRFLLRYALSLPIALSLFYWIPAISSSMKCTPMDLQSGCYGKVLIIWRPCLFPE